MIYPGIHIMTDEQLKEIKEVAYQRGYKLGFLHGDKLLPKCGNCGVGGAEHKHGEIYLCEECYPMCVLEWDFK